MNEVGEWLDGRRPAMPAELRRAVDAALDRAADDEPERVLDGPAGAAAGGESVGGYVADRLAGAALATLSRVARASPERGTAAELLAADALLTYACEAAAEAGPEALDRLTARLDYPRFAALLAPAVP